MILDTLAGACRVRVAQRKAAMGMDAIAEKAFALPKGEGGKLEKALGKEGLSFLCEVKKASPSKGIIAQNFPYVSIAEEYEAAGADAISVLTEEDFFLGSPRYLEEISSAVSVPTLRKDFVVDPYMIYEAKVVGASAVLLICAILTDQQLQSYVSLAEQLGLSALVEVHDECEMDMAANAGAKLIGVNNRDLRTFHVDPSYSLRLRDKAPKDAIFVAESGITGPQDIPNLVDHGVDAVLIGEAMMRADQKELFLQSLREAAR